MLYNEDCFDTMNRLHNKVDIVLTSPPYNTSKKIHTKKAFDNYNIFRQKAHGFNRGMNATCM